MKQLLLIRHAKATHETGYADFERPLKYSGLQDAAQIAGRLQEHSVIPQLIIASPALRTLSTANVFAEHLSLPQPETDRRIYEADLDALVDILSELPDDYNFIGLVGHNPGFSQLVYHLTSDIIEMETCSVVLIAFEATKWSVVGKFSGSVAYYTSPGQGQ